MSKITSYLSLQQVVKSFMNERGEKVLTNYEKYLQIAIEGFSSLNIFEMNTIDVAYLDVNTDTNVAELPVDFITMTKIGVRINGVLWTLSQNRDLILPRPETLCADIESTTTTDISGGYYFAPHYRYGAYMDTLYGVGGGFNVAYYRIDMTNRVIYFDGNVPNDEVILEYKSSGVKAGGALVPRQAAPALKAYLDWRITEMDFRQPMNEKQRKERLYDKELYSLTLLENSFTMEEYLDNAYSSYSQAPKR
jgi:hypothetical protein